MTKPATLSRKMADGTICRTGPHCKRHGNLTSASTVQQQLVAARKVVTEKIKTLPLPEGTTRSSQNTTNPDWAKPLYEQSRKVEETLTDRQAQVLYHYRMAGSRRINAYLRGGQEGHKTIYVKDHGTSGYVPTQESIDEDYVSTQKISAELDEILSHETPLPQGTVLYRAIKIDDTIPDNMTALQFLKNKFKIGDVYEDKAHMSTSADPDYMTFFGRKRIKAKGKHMVFEIVAKKGLPIFEENYSKEPHTPKDGSIQTFEREVLLNRNHKYRVVGVKNVTFAHAYPESLRGWGSSVNELPSKASYPVVQLEQL